jgi:hypothetical protein
LPALCLKPRNRYRASCAPPRLRLFQALCRASWLLPDAPRKPRAVLAAPAIPKSRLVSSRLRAAHRRGALKLISGRCSLRRRWRRARSRHARPAAVCGRASVRAISSNRRGCGEPNKHLGESLYSVRNLYYGAAIISLWPDREGWLYPAQQESLATSLSNVWAASFSPSTVVR